MAGMALVSGQFLSIDGSAAVPAWAFTSDPDVGVYCETLTLGVAIAGVDTAKFGAGGSAKMSQGLMLSQGQYDDNILEFQSPTDVAHGVTDEQETHTFGAFMKADGNQGGVKLIGITESYANAIRFDGVITSKDTTKGDGAWGAISLVCSEKSGTSLTNVGADGNLVIIRDYDGTRFIFDKEGSAHAEVEWIAFDQHDDLALVRDMEAILVGRESDAQTYRRHALEDMGIIGRDSWRMEKGKLKAMVNTSKLAMLHHGALIQSAERIAELESRIEELERRLT